MNLPIGIAKTDFLQKFGIPRQSGLVKEARALILLDPTRVTRAMLNGLSEFSHVWLIWKFHAVSNETLKPSRRAPRLGGKKRIGVLATRSPHRPNSIGLSVVRIEKISGLSLLVSGSDLLDGSPILDIKPYLPYADRPVGAIASYAQLKPKRVLSVQFALKAKRELKQISASERPRIKNLIRGCLALDPRPVHSQKKPSYAQRLATIDVIWRVDGNTAIVEELRQIL